MSTGRDRRCGAARQAAGTGDAGHRHFAGPNAKPVNLVYLDPAEIDLDAWRDDPTPLWSRTPANSATVWWP